jgi:hypothetical protein
MSGSHQYANYTANFTPEEYDAWFASFTEKNAEGLAAAGVLIVDFRVRRPRLALLILPLIILPRRQRRPTLIYQPHSNAHHP